MPHPEAVRSRLMIRMLQLAQCQTRLSHRKRSALSFQPSASEHLRPGGRDHPDSWLAPWEKADTHMGLATWEMSRAPTGLAPWEHGRTPTGQALAPVIQS
jgi:hypothetical protein